MSSQKSYSSAGVPGKRREDEDQEGLECLRPHAVAAQLGVSREHVLRLLRSGKLPGVRIGRCWTVRKSDLAAYFNKLLRGNGENSSLLETTGDD